MKAKALLAVLLGLGLFLALTLSLHQIQAQSGTRVIRVATTGNDTPNCGGPTNPCLTVQHAVDVAQPGDEIRVAGGTYTGINHYDDLKQVVYINKSVTIRGGYTNTNWDTPDPDANPTTLDAQGQGRVLYITGDISATIEGLRVTGGDAAGLGGGQGCDAGGGVYVNNATATISNNQVFNNTARCGGGLCLFLDLQEGAATLSGNTIFSNTADFCGGLSVESPIICPLRGNSVCSNTNDTCGVLSLAAINTTLSGNTITDNSANYGGGLCLSLRAAMLVNNLVVHNRADILGSGLVVAGSWTHLMHTTISRNSGGDGSGIYVLEIRCEGPPGLWLVYPSAVALTNTILVSHTVGITVTAGNTATLEATLWGTDTWANTTDWGGAGTIITGTRNYWGAPSFLDPDAGDYHIGPGSAAIDAGVDAEVRIDIDNEPRPYQGYDLGADEYWPEFERIYLPLVLRNVP